MPALRSIALLVLAVAASCALVGPKEPSPDEIARARAAERLRSPPEPTYDQVAVDTWAALKDEAVELSRLAERRATRDEVRAVAERGVLEARGDRETLAAWRVDWFGDAPKAVSATLPGVRFAARSVDLDTLQRAAPEDFDRVYLEMRIPLVEAEVALAGDVLAKAGRDELRGYARQVLDERAAELVALRRLYEAVTTAAP